MSEETIKHSYLNDYESDKLKKLQAKREAQAQYMKEYWKTYIKPPKTVDRDRELNLKRYHRIKKRTLCEICQKEYTDIRLHKLTAKHLAKAPSPLDVIGDLFPDALDSLIKKAEEATIEVEQLQQAKDSLDERLSAMIIKPIQIQTKKSRHGATRVSFG